MNKHFNILMADDDLEDVEFAKEIFNENEMPINFHSVKDGEALLNFLSSNQKNDQPDGFPHLILLDLNMPRLDGREALKEIKEDPRFRKIPVAIFTTSQSPDDIETAYSLGANCYVIKPSAFNEWKKTLNMISRFWTEYVKIPKLTGS